MSMIDEKLLNDATHDARDESVVDDSELNRRKVSSKLRAVLQWLHDNHVDLSTMAKNQGSSTLVDDTLIDELIVDGELIQLQTTRDFMIVSENVFSHMFFVHTPF
jgi:hypothetical protein